MWYKFSLYPYYLKKEAAMKQTHSNSRRSVYFEGLRDGFPIGLGYFAVSFSLGIAARNAGLTVTQGLLSSLLCNASAGEYALFTLIGSGAACVEIALATLIINARYLLMSCALSQRMSPDMPFYHRFFVGFDVTDELFGITIARPGCVEPRYFYGAMTASIPMWAAGTALGIFMGNLLPARIVSALSVALYGMFLAIIVPPAKENRVVLGCVLSAFAASAAFAFLPVLRDLSSGNRTIILTVVISALAAVLLPRPAEEEAAARQKRSAPTRRRRSFQTLYPSCRSRASASPSAAGSSARSCTMCRM